MALFERLASALFGGGEKSADSAAERALVSDTLEEVASFGDGFLIGFDKPITRFGQGLV